MSWSNDNVSEKWSEGKELFPGVKEKVKYDPTTGRWESMIYKEGGDTHFHGWIDPSKGDAGGETHRNK